MKSPGLLVALGHAKNKTARCVLLATGRHGVGAAWIEGRGATRSAIAMSPSEARRIAAELVVAADQLDAKGG